MKYKELVQDLTEEKSKNKDDPCWPGYKMVGWKEQNGKKVPNCVLKSKNEK